MKRINRVISLFLAGVMTFTSLPVSAFAEAAEGADKPLTWQDYEYTILEDGTVSVCGYTGTAGEGELLTAEIPAEIDGMAVTKIAEEAFAYQEELDGVLIPDSVTMVENSAFYQCDDLKVLAFAGEMPAFDFTVAEGSSSLQTVLALSDSDTDPLWTLLVHDLGEEQIQKVRLQKYDNADNLKASWEDCLEKLAAPDEAATAPSPAPAESTPEPTVQPTAQPAPAPEPTAAPAPVPGPQAVQQPAALSDAAVTPTPTPFVRNSGQCGNDASWVLTSDGYLRISGTGSMRSYQSGNIPWSSYKNQIEHVVVGEGITSIGNSAFQNLTYLKDVSLPESLERIEDNAFSGCTSLTGDLRIPHKVSYIGSGAFSRCAGLSGELELPRQLSTIGSSAFYGCAGLQGSLVIPQNVVDIGNSAFSGCIGFTGALTIPDSVETIGYGAFGGMDGITSITFGKGLTALTGSRYAETTVLSGMSALETVTFTGQTAPTLDDNLMLVGDCPALQAIRVPQASFLDYRDKMQDRLPATVPLLPDGSSEGDFLIQDNVLLAYLGSDSEVTVPDGVTAIGSIAFRGNTTITRVLLPEELTDIGDGAFASCTALTEVVCPQSLQTIGDSAFAQCTTLTTLDLPQGLRSIGSSAMEGCAAWQGQANLTGLQSLGEGAFRSSGIQKVTLGGGLAAIGAEAFYECRQLEEIVLSQGLQEIGKGAFRGCSALKSLELPATLTAIGEYAFYKCSAMTGDLTIPDSVTALGQYAFSGCSALDGTLTIGSGLTTFGIHAFEGDSSLTGLVLPEGFLTIPDYAFTRCEGLTGDLILPDGIASVGSYAFDGCSGLDGTLHLPASLTSIGKYAFRDCRNLTGTLRIPDGVTSIPEGAFARMKQITDVVIGEGVQGCYYSTSDSSAYPFIDMNLQRVTFLTDYISSNMFNFMHPREVGLKLENYVAQMEKCAGTFSRIKVYIVDQEDPWVIQDGVLVAYTGTDPQVTVPDSVTAIGDFAFWNSQSTLQQAVLPQGLTSVGNRAFYRCAQLTDLVLPDSVTAIGERAFYDCRSLKSSHLPQQLQTLGAQAFYYCSAMEGVLTIPAGVTVIEDSTFERCTSLTGLQLPDSLTSIGDSAFQSCSGLTSLQLPDSLTDIGNSAFQNCTGLTGTLTLPQGLTQLGDSAFSGCGGITGDLVLPQGLEILPLSAITGMQKITSLTVPASVVTISGSFSNMGALEEITLLPTQVPSFSQKQSLQNLSALRKVYVPEESYEAYQAAIQASLPDTAQLVIYGADTDFLIQDNVLVAYTGDGGDVTVPEGVTEIGDSAFLNAAQVTSVTLPETVIRIGTEAFRNCSALTAVTLPANLASLGESAFRECSALTRVTLPDTLTSLGSYAFASCTGLVEVRLPAGMTEIPERAFSGCSSLAALDLPENLTAIGEGAFYGCTGLTGTLQLPEGLTALGDRAFYECTGLTGMLQLPQGLTTLSDSAFYGCEKLTGIAFPEGLTAIGSNAFYRCTGLKELKLNQGLKTIGQNAFYYCTGLTGTLEIPESVTSIGGSAFENCRNLTGELVLPEGLTSLGSRAFASCTGFTGTVVVPDQVTVLNIGVFSGMSGITRLELGSGIASFATITNDSNQTLGSLPNVTTLVFHAAVPPEINIWNNVTRGIFDGMPALQEIDVPLEGYTDYYRKFKNMLPSRVKMVPLGQSPEDGMYILDGVLCAYTGGADAVVPCGVTAIADYAFHENTGLRSVVLPETVTSIGQYAFQDCTALEEINLPEGLTRIDTGAFRDCTALQSVRLPSTLTTLGQYAFTGCIALTGDIRMPAALTDIGNYAFSNCTGLDGTVTYEPGVRETGDYVFNGCTGLTGLVLGEGLTRIGSGTFGRCSGLSGSLEIPQTVTAIDSGAFSGCKNLTGKLELPRNLTSLGSNAFSGCSGFTGELVIPDGITLLPTYAFFSMTGITSVVFGEGMTQLQQSSESNSPLNGMTAVTELSFLGSTPPQCSSSSYNPFAELTALQTVYVPEEALDAYEQAYRKYLPESVVFSTELIRANIQDLTPGVYSRSVTLRWAPHRSDQVVGYVVERDGQEIARTQDCTYTDTGLATGTAYTYEVYGTAADGRTTGSAAVQVTPQAPEILDIQVANGTDTVNLDNTILISVRNTGNLDPQGDRETVGQLYYLQDGQRILIGSCRRDAELDVGDRAFYTAHWDTTLLDNGSYELVFVLTDVDGTSAELSRTLSVDNSRPKPIPGFAAAVEDSIIHLSWPIAEEADTIGYHIYRRAGEGEFTLLAEINSRFSLQYYDGRVDNSTVYHYYIVAVSSLQQEGEPSEIIAASLAPDTQAPTVQTLSPADSGPLTGTVTFQMTARDDFAVVRAELQYSSDGQQWTTLHQSAGGSCTAELDTTTLPDGILYVQGVAWDAAGNESTPLTRQYTVKNGIPAPVQGLSGTATATAITLRWETPAEDVDHFEVEEKQPDGSYRMICNTGRVLGANLTGLTPGTAYTYRVVAWGPNGIRGIPTADLVLQTLADAQAPVITGIQPAPGRYRDVIPVSITATDNDGIASITLQVSTDSLEWTDVTTQNFDGTATARLTLDFSLEGYEEGGIWLRGVATDNAGNRSDTGSEAPYTQYRVDRTPPAAPQAVLAAPGDGIITISWEQGTEMDLGLYSVYRSDRPDGEFVLLESGLQAVSYVDRTVGQNKTWYYQVTVSDQAGNESQPSAVVSTAAQPDTQAPVVASVSPVSGRRLSPMRPVVTLAVKDNQTLQSVRVEYSTDGSSYQLLKEETGLSVSSRYLSLELPLEGLADGQTLSLRARAEDAAGNTGDWLEAQYLVDTTPPAVSGGSVQYADGTVLLQWSGAGEADLSAYRIYRTENPDNGYTLIGTAEAGQGNLLTYTDTDLPGSRVTYFYQIETEDAAGNTARADLGSVTVEPDRRSAPKAVLSCESTMEIGVEYIISGLFSRDDTGIAGYRIDFGDGTSTTRDTEVHVYDRVGSYTVTLTVTDTDGMESTVTRQVQVKERGILGKAKVRVVDESGLPMMNIPVYFDLGEDDQIIRMTDSDGYASFDGVVGSHTVASFVADGDWLPVKREITLAAGQTTEETLTMVREALVEGQFEVDRMTYEEIEAAGIDPADPANQCILKIEMKLTYAEKELNTSFTYNTSTGKTTGGPIMAQSGGVIHQLIPVIILPSGIQIKDKEDDEDEGGGVAAPWYSYSHEISVAYLDIPVGIQALKDMFDVRLHIINNASADFSMLDNSIRLDLPEGLTLMDVYGAEYRDQVSIAEIKGQTTETVRWVIRGDEVGEYDLAADFSGVLSGFNAPFQARFESEEPLQVYGLSGLNVLVEIADALDNGTFYYNVTMENQSPVDLYAPDITTDSLLIQARVFDGTGLDVSNQMEWLVEETESDFELVPDVSESIRVLPAGHRLLKNYMEVDQTVYTDTELKLRSTLKKIIGDYEGVTLSIQARPVDYFTERLSAKVDAGEKAELTFTKNQDALSYLMNDGNYVYESMYHSTGELEGQMPTKLEAAVWDFLDGNFSDLLLGTKVKEQSEAIILAAMNMSAEKDDFSRYKIMCDWLSGAAEWIKDKTNDNEVINVAVKQLKKKVKEATEEQLQDMAVDMIAAWEKALEKASIEKRWEMYQSAFETKRGLDDCLVEAQREIMEQDYADTLAVLKKSGYAKSEDRQMLHSFMSTSKADKVWEGLGAAFEVASVFVDSCEDASKDLNIYLEAQCCLNSCLEFLNTLIEYPSSDADTGYKLYDAALRVKEKVTDNDKLRVLMKEFFENSIEKAVDEIGKEFMKWALGSWSAALSLGIDMVDAVLNIDGKHAAADDIRIAACMSDSIQQALSWAQRTYRADPTEENAIEYMKKISYLLNAREIGESQVAAFGISYEIGTGPNAFDNRALLEIVCQVTGTPSKSTWLAWRDYVQDQTSKLRVQLLRSPLNEVSDTVTMPEVTFNYLTGRTVQQFSADYAYSLDDGASWTPCTGDTIAVEPAFYTRELLVKYVGSEQTGTELISRTTLYPPVVPTGLRVLQTETGYRLEGLDNSLNYEVTFSPSPLSPAYGEALAEKIPAGSSSYLYEREESVSYAYVRAVADEAHYASYPVSVRVYPMADISAEVNGGGTVAGTGRYEYGTPVTLYSTESANYQFAGWYENGLMISNSKNLTFTAAGDRHITARFDQQVTGWVKNDTTGWVTGIAAGTSAEEVIAYFATQGTATVTKPDGSTAEQIATGDILTVDDTSYTIVVLGDVNGDALIDGQDLQAMIRHLTFRDNLEGAFLEAGLFCQNQDMDIFDLYQAMEAQPQMAAVQEGG